MNNEQDFTRNKIFTGVFFCIMIAGMTGSVIFYQRSVSDRKKLAEKGAELEQSRDSLDAAYRKLDSIKLIIQSERDMKQETINTITLTSGNDPKVSRVLKASDYEEQGYKAILQNDFQTAKAAFKQSEEAYPGYHNAFEIYKYLDSSADKLKTSSGQQQAKQTINIRFNNYRSPVQLIDTVATRIKAKEAQQQQQKPQPNSNVQVQGKLVDTLESKLKTPEGRQQVKQAVNIRLNNFRADSASRKPIKRQP